MVNKNYVSLCLNKVALISSVVLLYFMLFNACALSSTDNGSVYLGGGYTYYDEIGAILSDQGGVDIPDRVLSYNVDSTWIVIKQKPNHYRNVMYKYNDNFKSSDYVYGIDSEYYWIIDKEVQQVMGPYTHGKYKQAIDSARISLKLPQQANY